MLQPVRRQIHIEHYGKLVTAGGRVLNVCAKGRTVAEARAKAYAAAEKIQFEGKQFRTDIGIKYNAKG